jgi:hypothetical protein
MDAPLPRGTRVERVDSPPNSPIKDGVCGTIVEVLPAANGEFGYFVRVEPGVPPAFWSGSCLRAVSAD